MKRNKDDFIKHEIKEVSFYVILGIIVAILLPIYLGFVLQGFEDSFVKGRPLVFGDILVTYMIYYIMIMAGLIGLPILKIREMFITSKGEKPYALKKPTAFSVAYLHDPETDGALYHFSEMMGYKGNKNFMRWSFSILRVFVISTLIFGSLGLVQTLNPSAQFVGIPQIAFQMTETAEVLFTAEPPAFAETTMMIFVLSLLMGFNAWLCSKFKMGSGVYWLIALLFICPLIGVSWMGFHSIVYGNNETALFATFLFGYIGSTLTVLFGTFILWYVWHFWNNVFAKLREVVPAKENIIFVSVVILFFLLVIYIGIEIYLKSVKKSKSDKFSAL